MNRIDRLSAILTHLQSSRLITAADIARRFDISLRTVYRDIRALGQAGVPVIGEAGLGYSIMEGYRLPPVMFTREEALAFLMAEKIVKKVTDQHNSEQFQSAMYKIRAVLRTSEKSVLDDVEENIEVISKRNSLFKSSQSNLLQILLGSIADQKVVDIKYTTFDKEETTRRPVEPVGIYYAYDQWYLIAYCRLRTDYRTFRIDRIASTQPTNAKFEKQHPSLKEYLDKIERKEKLIKVVLLVDQSIMKFIRQQKYDQGLVLENNLGDKVEMTFMVSSIYSIARWIIMMADHLTVVQPEYLRVHLIEMTERIIGRLKDTSTKDKRIRPEK